MALQQTVWILVFIMSAVCAAAYDHHPPAIFTFGDSLSDVGNLYRLVPGPPFPCSGPPYGVTLGSITGRCTDGLLVIDIISKYLGMGLAIPSLAFNSTSFKSLDFAYAGAMVLPDSPRAQPSLLLQISQFLAYKASVLAENALQEARFGKSFYVVEIGTNDIREKLGNMSFETIKTDVVPRVIEGLRAGIVNLYQNGSRHFFIVNVPGIGCSPYILAQFQKAQGLKFDRFGCLEDVNEVVAACNEGIKVLVMQLRHELPQGRFVLFDLFKAKFSVLRNSHKLGFKFTTQAACCGSGGAYNCSGPGGIPCGCGSLVTTACHNPNEYISWDGLHYTQSFYTQIAEAILKKKYMDA